MNSQKNQYKDTVMLSGFAPKGFRTKICKLFEIDHKTPKLWASVYGVKHKETHQLQSFGATIAVKKSTDKPSEIIRKIKYSQAKDLFTIQFGNEDAIVSTDDKTKAKLKNIVGEILAYLEFKSSDSEESKTEDA